MQKLGEVITEIKFPSSLAKGEKITGTITLKNPYNENNVELLCEVTTWDGNYYARFVYVNAGQTHTFNFPSDFTLRIPENAPDPVMPDKDATLTINGTAIATTTQMTETATVTIKLSMLKEQVLGIPLSKWIVLTIGVAAAIVVGVFVLKKRPRKILK
jgi:hypothetical protein